MPRLLRIALALSFLTLAHCGGTDDGSADNVNAIRGTEIPTTTFVIRIENVSTPTTLIASTGSLSIPLSPGAFAIHSQANPLFTPNAPADAGIELIAESGNELEEFAELADEDGVLERGRMFVPVGRTERGGLFPGDAYEFSVRALPGERLSFATMFVESNDLFFAPRGAGIALFDADGNPTLGNVTNQVFLWDAGTEVNEEPGVGPNQAPREPAPNTGTPENGVVRLITAVNDGYRYPAVTEVIRVTVRLQQ